MLGASAATPGFLRALLRPRRRARGARVAPGRWYAALRAWAARGPGAVGLRRGARRRSTAPTATRWSASAAATRGCTPSRRSTRCALEPARWGGTPVLLYGFDDLTPLAARRRRDARGRTAAPTSRVSLTYEPGRAAFAGRGATFQELLALGAEHVAARGARRALRAGSAALHDLERGLFEAGGVAPFDPGGGGRRCSRAAASGPSSSSSRPHVARLHPRGALRARGDRGRPAQPGRERGADRATCSRAAGIPVALVAPPRRRAHGARPRRARPAALRACSTARADDLLAWLRTPGKLERPAARRPPRGAGAADRRADRGRGAGPVGGRASRRRAGRARPRRRGPRRAAPRRCASGSRPRRRRSSPRPTAARRRSSTGAAALDARVAGAAAGAPWASSARSPPAPRALAPSAAELARTLERLEVFAGDGGRAGTPGRGRGHLAAADPRAPRARAVPLRPAGGRVPAPRRAPSRSWATPSAARSTRPRACAWRLREDELARERFLFYAAISRPTERARAVVARRRRRGRAARALAVRRRRRSTCSTRAPEIVRRPLGAAGFDAALAPHEREVLRERLAAQSFARRRPPAPIAPLSHPAVLAALRERETWSASALEAWAGCPVKWFVERLLRPEDLAPDPEPMLPRRARPPRARGGDARARLDRRRACAPRTSREAKRRPARRARAPRDATPASRRTPSACAPPCAAWRPTSCATSTTRPTRARSSRRRTSSCASAARRTSCRRPSLAGGELRLAGRDRPRRHRAGRRGDRLRLQGPVGAAVAGALAHRGQAPDRAVHARAAASARARRRRRPLPAARRRGRPPARPAALEDADAKLDAFRNDRLDDAAFEERLRRRARRRARRRRRGIRSGALEPRPATCAWNGGCAHPSICRCEA